jgi:TRAP-type mannitol/chloroaromatic compound transport system permease small subunit
LAATNNRPDSQTGRPLLGDGDALRFLLAVSRRIDWLNERVGQTVYWMVLAAVLVSSGNAVVRYLFDYSSNAWLELQWYLYTSFFLLGAGYTLLRNEHVRIDIINSRMSPRARAWIDLLGGLFFLLPMAVLIMTLAWPVFTESYALHETSPSANGLVRWPVKLMIPVGFCLLALQGLSEITKRAAFLMNLIPDPTPRHVHGEDELTPHDLVEGAGR